MGKNRELASYFSNKIWRTVVVAGAMLAVPACSGGGNSKPAPTAPKADSTPAPPAGPQPAPKPDGQAVQKTDADGKAADEQKSTDDKKAADEKAEADRKAQKADTLEAPPVRPRGGGGRPTGRGFILS